jgi:hypothetical protein
MYEIIKSIHSYLAYAAILLLALATINGIIGTFSNKIFNENHRKINVFALISAHTMLLLGIVLLFVSPLTQSAFADMGAAMKNPTLRTYAVEHPTINIIAAILVTIGNAKTKRLTTNGPKFKTTAIFYGLALLLILSRIPYSAWLGLAS